jgi:SpoVK/Ycf46/Vps4 family AAA+-type ATPase
MTETYVPPLTNLPYRKIGLSYADSQFAAVPTQQVFIEEMKQSFRYFFSAEENSFQNDFPNQVNSTNFPFKGFLLSGKPGVGKTEAVIEACRALAGSLDDAGIELELLHISSQSIFRSAVGEMESRLARVFEDAQDSTNHRKRTILLFDDIDTMLVKRTEENPSEWSRSLNGVFFHHCDRMIASKVLIVATTNVPEKIDDAIHSRLFMRPVPEPTVEELVSVAENVLPLNPKGFDKKEMLASIEAEIRRSVNDGETASFRLARKIAIIEIVNGVVFR